MELLIVDVETTGTDPATDGVVELAMLDYRRPHAGDVQRPVCSLINPERPIPPEASAIHHIVDADVAAAPSLGKVWHGVASGTTMCAHNAAFDAAFLGVEPTAAVCTMRLAKHLVPGLPSYALMPLWYRFGLRKGVRSALVAHSAAFDTMVCRDVLNHLLVLMPEALECSGADLAAYCWRPITVTTMPFGKHRGERLDAVPRGYLAWALANADIDDDLRASIRGVM